MTQEEIIEYNKRCAEFLGWKLDSEHSKYLYYSKNRPRKEVWDYRSMLYASDWNWIMEVVEAIQKIIIKDDKEFCIEFYQGLPNKIKTFVSIGKLKTERKDPKEAVAEVINQFLIWYEQNK